MQREPGPHAARQDSRMHDSFLDAGADIIETNSFRREPRSCSPSTASTEHAREINRLAGTIARAAADAAQHRRPAALRGGLDGPDDQEPSRSPAASPSISSRDAYQEQAEGLIEGGADLLLLETVQDTLNCKAGLVGIERAIAKTGVAVAVAVSGTIETMGTLLGGQDIEAFYTSLAHRDLLWMGLNCATGPDFMTDHLRTLSEICALRRRLRAQRRPARRGRPLQRDARDRSRANSSASSTPDGSTWSADAAARRPRTSGCWRRWPRASGRAERSTPAALGGLGHRGAGDRRRHAAGDRRRAHQRARQPQVQAADRGGQARGGGRGRPRCRCAAARTCSTSACRIPIATRWPTSPRFLEIVVKKVKVPLMIDSTDAA